MDQHRIALQLRGRGERADRALDDLRQALPDATVGRPDDTGTFEVTLAASSQDEALRRAWDAVGGAGADDHVVFLEHPDLSGHWKRTEGGDVAAPGNRRR